MNEIEVKAKVSNPSLLRKNLKKLGIKLSPSITQKDRVYFPKESHLDLNLGRPIVKMEKAPALRIREQGKDTIFTYKIPVSNNLDKLEYESKIDDAEAIAHICEALGFELRVRINKVRRKAHYQGYEICVDEVEGLGSYIEVEKMSDDPAEEIQKDLWKLLLELGIKEEDRELHGYDILIARKEK